MAESAQENAVPGKGQIPRLDALTCLRGPAALAVVLYHFDLGIFRDLNLTQFLPLVAHYYLGVDLFFILSGFILTHVHGRDFRRFSLREGGRFYALRLIRIYPVHAALMLAYVVLLLAAQIVGPALGLMPQGSADAHSGQAFLWHMLLLQPYGLTWNFPAWSVSAEWIAYLGFPVLAFFLPRVPRRWCVVLLIGVVASFAWVYATVLNLTLDWTGLSRVVFEFVAGALLWHVAWRGRSRWTRRGLAAAGVLGLLVMQTRFLDMGCVLALGAVIGLAGGPVGAVARRPMPASLLWLGEVSYSIYMVQAIVLATAGRLVEKLLPHLSHGLQLAMVPVLLGAIILAGAIVNRVVERPARSKLRDLLDRSRARVRPPEGETAPAWR